MKTFKQLREKWIKSGKTDYFGRLDIYQNPTRKELYKMVADSGYHDVRGFMTPKGDVYVSTGGLHSSIAKIMKNEIPISKSIPFVIKDVRAKPPEIMFATYNANTTWGKQHKDAYGFMIKNKWVVRTLGKVSDYDTYKQLREKYLGIEKSHWGTRFEVFENPSRKELRDVGRLIRAVITPDKMYISNAKHALHADLMKTLKLKTKKFVNVSGAINGQSIELNLSMAEMIGVADWNTKNGTYEMSDMAEMLQKHKYLNRTFPNWSLN